MELYDLIMNAPDNARVAIIYPNGEDICDAKELKALVKRDDQPDAPEKGNYEVL